MADMVRLIDEKEARRVDSETSRADLSQKSKLTNRWSLGRIAEVPTLNPPIPALFLPVIYCDAVASAAW